MNKSHIIKKRHIIIKEDKPVQNKKYKPVILDVDDPFYTPLIDRDTNKEAKQTVIQSERRRRGLFGTNQFPRLVPAIFIAVILFCGFGCQQNGRLEFVAVVQDHKKLSIETNDAVIATFRGEMDNMRFKGTLTPEIELAVNKLIERLEMIKKQSQLISEYVQSAYVDEELLSELLKATWKTPG